MKNIFEVHKQKIAEQNAKMPEPIRAMMNPQEVKKLIEEKREYFRKNKYFGLKNH